MEYEYKVEQIDTFIRKRGFVDGRYVENIINEYAAKGWEYQNAIPFPVINDGTYWYHPPVNLVFRRSI